MSELDDFYELLNELRAQTGGPRTLEECTGSMNWPKRGVYFFFEEGEIRADGSARTVRVGTHALGVGARSTLWGRLAQHRGNVGGMLAGGGSHRGSVFRLHVGASLLRRDGDPAGIGGTWGKGSSADRITRESEYLLEQRVSEYIGRMLFLWIGVDDEPGPLSERSLIERGAISLLSARSNPQADSASANWLGNFSDRSAIASSGTWNVNHVDDPRQPRLLDAMARWIHQT